MTRLVTGAIDYEAHSTLSDSALEAMERAGACLLAEQQKNLLRQLAFTWIERRHMVRPDYPAVRKILNKLIHFAAGGKVDPFLARTTKLASCSEYTHPAEAYVYDHIRSEFKISLFAEWRNRVRVGQIHLEFIRLNLFRLRSQLAEAYGCKKGGRRDHDFGFVIQRLAKIFHEAGGIITASSQIDPRAGPTDPLWVEASKFIAFSRAFIAHLPGDPSVATVDVGRLIHLALPYCAQLQQVSPSIRVLGRLTKALPSSVCDRL